MSEHIATLSENELAELISQASRELEAKRQGKKREIVAQIKELATSIGVTVEFSESERKPNSRKGSSVPIKYRDPDNPRNYWTGRGMKPRWLNAQLELGRSLDDFKI